MNGAWSPRGRLAASRASARSFRELSAPAAVPVRIALVLTAVGAASSLLPYIGIWLLAREALRDIPRAGTIWWAVVVVGIGAVLGFVTKMAAYTVSHHADLRVQHTVRDRVVAHLAELPLGWFSANTGGQALDALQTDVESLHSAVAHGRMELVSAMVTPALALGWLATVDWRLAVLVLAPSVVVHLYQQRVLAGAAERVRGVGRAAIMLVDATTELVRDMATLRITGRGAGAGSSMTAAADALHDALRDAYEQDTMKVVRSGALVDVVTSLAVVLGAGTAMIAAGWLAPLDLLPFALLAASVSTPLQDVALARSGVRSAHLAADRINALLSVPPLPRAASPVEPVGHEVRFDDVTFGYLQGEPTLRGISLCLREGTVTALVGPSGAGKSTVAALLARFHDVDAGSIRVGGADVRDMSTDRLYRTVGFVFQDAHLLRTSLRDNIRLARPDATEPEVVAAARAARIHDRLLLAPRGYDSVYGEDVSLSGGERARVAIARTLLADPSVLVLDEATAHVDPEAEGDIQNALSELAVGRTVLVVAHRLSTVTEADQILVLDRGQLVQRGVHAELAEAPGVYRRLLTAMSGSGAHRPVPAGTVRR